MKIQVLGLKAAQSATERTRRLEGARLGLRAAALHLKGRFATYPKQKRGVSRASVYGKTFKSDKQRRYVMGALRRGEWPYKRGMGRSQRMGQRWAVDDRGLRQVIGNNADYAGWVQGPRQSRYMAAMGWERLDVIAKREAGTIQAIVDREVKKAL